MNATTEAPTTGAASARAAGAELEKCAAFPILFLLFSAGLWFLLAVLAALVTSVKLHAPAMLAGDPMFTYGRLHAASDTALLYGFGVPAALGISLWLICRQGRVSLSGPAVIAVAAMFWNFGVAGSVWGDLRGAGPGYEAFEIPLAMAPILWVAYVLIGICAVLTFHRRQSETLYPSQWFVIGALFWFAWIFPTAALLLLHQPVRGALQASVNWWYENNLSAVFLGFAGLASLFYFIPKLTGRPLHSRYLAAFGFWLLALTASCGGMLAGAPLPSWITGVSAAGTVCTIVPIAAVAVNLYLTSRDTPPGVCGSFPLRFFGAAMMCWIVAGTQQALTALPSVGRVLNFTWAVAAQRDLFRYGFFAMTAFGAAYYFLPRLAAPNEEAPDGLMCPRLMKAHFWLTAIGVGVGYLSMLIAGVWQGLALENPANTFPGVMKSVLMPLRLSTLEPLLLATGAVLFLLNFARLLKNHCCCCHCACGSPEGQPTKEAA